MSADEIKLALRLVAMGRVNHPQVDELAEALAGVFSRKCEPLPVVEMPTEVVLSANALQAAASQAGADYAEALTQVNAPKRRKKAD